MHTFVHRHVRVCAYIHVYMYVHTHMCMYTYMYLHPDRGQKDSQNDSVCVCVIFHACVFYIHNVNACLFFVLIFLCAHVCVCVYIAMCVYTYRYVYIHIYIYMSPIPFGSI